MDYRIRHIKGFGYSPEVYDPVTDSWWVIKGDLTEGVSAEDVTARPSYLHDTEASAGELIDKFAAVRSSETVWSGSSSSSRGGFWSRLFGW